MIHYLTSDSLMIPNKQLLVALSQFGHGLLSNVTGFELPRIIINIKFNYSFSARHGAAQMKFSTNL